MQIIVKSDKFALKSIVDKKCIPKDTITQINNIQLLQSMQNTKHNSKQVSEVVPSQPFLEADKLKLSQMSPIIRISPVHAPGQFQQQKHFVDQMNQMRPSQLYNPEYYQQRSQKINLNNNHCDCMALCNKCHNTSATCTNWCNTCQYQSSQQIKLQHTHPHTDHAQKSSVIVVEKYYCNCDQVQSSCIECVNSCGQLCDGCCEININNDESQTTGRTVVAVQPIQQSTSAFNNQTVPVYYSATNIKLSTQHNNPANFISATSVEGSSPRRTYFQ